MTAPKYNIGMQNIPPKTLVGNMLDYWAPPVPLDNDDLANSSKIEIITADKVLSATALLAQVTIWDCQPR